MQQFDLLINGQRKRVRVDADKPLLFVLRDDCGLTGCKYGCGEGQCGACTVIIEGRAVRSCITPVASAAGKPIRTIESLEKNGQLDPVQEAFIGEDAMQCGYCITGMIMSARALLDKNPNPTEAHIKQAMQGNICRCGTYPRIVAAIQKAARTRRAAR